MYEVIFTRSEGQIRVTTDALSNSFNIVADSMEKEVSELRYTDISLMGDKEDADWVVDYYGKIVAVIIRK